MNCQSGDLARIILPGPLQDKIIRVVALDPSPDLGGVPCWLYAGPRIPTPYSPGFVLDSFRDSILRPIGNPGPTERDETLDWLKVPSRTKENT